jgi:tripartite-type tricarboxylate transporter receptor subunit TctC
MNSFSVGLRLIYLALVAAWLVVSPASGETYPTKLIRLVVPFPAGGLTDVVARITADYLSRKTGQQVIVENRSGAGANVGSDTVAKSKPDGYTLLVVTRDPIDINPFIYKHMPFNPLLDLTPVAALGGATQLVVVNGKLPAHTLQQLLSLA